MVFERKLVKPTAPPWTAQTPNSVSSILATANNDEIMKKYDVANVHDPLARPSKHFDRTDASCSRAAYIGDNQTWVEKVLMSTTSCEPRSFFMSKTVQVPDEPPTGASRVLYLRDSFRERQKCEIKKNGKKLMRKFSQYRKDNRQDKKNEKQSNL